MAMSENETQVLSEIVGVFTNEPCLLGIIIVVIGCFGLIRYTYQHQERMEAMRLKQHVELMKESRDESN